MLRVLVIVILMGCFIGPATAQSIGGVDCAAIRKLTRIERWYWIKRLGLSQEQVDQIRTRCRIR